MDKAAIYCRISRDPEGLRAGVERQEEDCRALAKRQGLTVVDVFTDNDTSASTLKRKARPAYDAMLHGARTGQFQTIIAYSNSRLTRRLMELEDLIRLHEKHGTIITTVVSGTDDLSTADGRMVARIKASVDSAEAERTSERLRRAMEQRAARGAPWQGPRVFGWESDRVTAHPVEAPLIREAARRILDGSSLNSIAAEWRAAGIKTAPGGQWTHTAVGRILRKPRLAGIQTRHGEIMLDGTGQPIIGQWEPIMDRDEFDRLQVALQRRSRQGGTFHGHRKYLLSGIVRCGVCGARLYGMPTPRGYAYSCQREGSGHSCTIQGPKTDALVTALAMARMATVDLNAEADDAPQEPPAEDARLARIPQLIAELLDAFNAGQLSGPIVFPQIKRLEEERVTLEAQRSERIKATATPTPVNVEQFTSLDMERQRAILESLLDAVVVAPAKRRGEPWTPGRITPAWK